MYGVVHAVFVGLRRLIGTAVDDPGPQRHLAHPHPPLLVLDDVADSFVVVAVDLEPLLLSDEEIREHVEDESDATNASSGSTHAGFEYGAGTADGAADAGTVTPPSKPQTCSREYLPLR